MTDPNHTQLLQWIVVIMIALGGGMLGIMARMVRGKQNKEACNLLHQTLTESLSDIKQRLEKGDTKMDGMKETLVRIATTLELTSKEETVRYDRHTEKLKDE